eukprot:313284_1
MTRADHIRILLYLSIAHIMCRPSLIGYGGMAASEHYIATEAGIEILKSGGNAADAAVAMQLVLNQVQPTSSGIGGGCFILYYHSESQQVYAIDGREEAPKAFNPQVFCQNINCFLQNTTNYQPTGNCDCKFLNQTISSQLSYGGLSVGVPGTLYALAKLNKHFGSCNGNKWSDSFQYAINIAQNGFNLTQSLYNSINGNNKLAAFQSTRDIYFKQNTTIPKVNPGELFINEDFAKTLQLLSKSSDEAIEIFYKGEIAEAIVNVIKTEGNYSMSDIYPRWGLMEMEDINGYKAVFREPVISNYGNEDIQFKMWGHPMPSSGSLTVEYLMNLLYFTQKNENNDFSDFINGETLTNYSIYSDVAAHYLYTANNIAFADRNKYMADSDFIDVPVDGLSDLEYIKQRVLQYMNDTFVETPIPFGNFETETTLGDSYNLNEEYGTSHFFVIDKDNNLACITTTIESGWGSGVTVPGYGFLLNNELTDFERLGYDINGDLIANAPQGGKRIRRTALDIFNLKDSETLGGKRPRSSMAPMIVTDINGTRPIFAAGSPGGSYIISTTFNVLSKLLIYDMNVQDAIDADRLWAFNANTMILERGWFVNNSNLTSDLVNNRGYDGVSFNTVSNGRCQAVKIMDPVNDFMRDNGFYSFEGGADSNRRQEANVMTVCEGYEQSNDDIPICNGEIPNVVCDTSDGLSSLEMGLLIGGIVVFVVFVIISVVCYMKLKRKNKYEQYVDMSMAPRYGTAEKNDQ